MLAAWIQASRPVSQANIAGPLVLGQALAFAVTGRFAWWALGAIHLFGVLDQLFIVWANDSADAEADRRNDAPTPFSGGSRVIPEGKLTPRQLAAASIGAAVALGMLCVVLALAGRPLAILFWLAAVALLWAYSFGPIRLSYRGDGEVLQGLGVGCVLPLFGYYLQAGDLDAFPLDVLLPTFALGYAGNVLTALPDRPADAAAGKRTLAVRIGQRPARAVFVVLVLGAVASVSFVGPSLSVAALAWTCTPAALAALMAASIITAGESDGRATVRLVVAGGLAINLLLAGWSLGLFTAG